jgi:hypothetical protein
VLLVENWWHSKLLCLHDECSTTIRADEAAGESASFTEAPAWREVGRGWQPLFGNFRGLGFSIEWHDFFARKELDWSASFHPGCVELCLNLEGNGFVESGGSRAEFAPGNDLLLQLGLDSGINRNLPLAGVWPQI